MQLESLKLFHDLAQTKSFTATARNFGVTQSAVSQQITMLEREFNVSLAERSRTIFRLTPAGKVLRDYCAELVRLARELDREMEQARETATHSFTLAVCCSIGLHQLPDILRRFQAGHPEVRVTVHLAYPERVHQDVLANAADLGLTVCPQRLPGLVIEPVREEPLVLVCHPQHPLASRPAVSLMDLQGEKLISVKHVPHPVHPDKLPKNLRHSFETAEEFSEVELVKRVVEMEGGVALLPAATVRQEVALKTLAAVPLTGGNYFQPQAVIYRQNQRLTPAMKQVIECLKQPEPMAAPPEKKFFVTG